MDSLKDKKGSDNLVADHLSRMTETDEGCVPIADNLPGDNLMQVLAVKGKSPWYADFVNYLVCQQLPANFTYQQRKKFLHTVKEYCWDEPYLFKHCKDGIMRRCIPEEEINCVIYHCHSSPYGGHVGADKTQAKIL
jgi:hypothetical protein